MFIGCSLNALAAYQDINNAIDAGAIGQEGTWYLKYSVLDPSNGVSPEATVELDGDDFSTGCMPCVWLSAFSENRKMLNVYQYDPVADSIVSVACSVKSNLTPLVFYESETRYAVISTNIPVYISDNSSQIEFIEAMRAFYASGVFDGIINSPDYENISTDDDTFKLTGFNADNTITASWTGTTHDDKSEEYAEMFVELTAGYAYVDAPEQVVATEPYVGEYDIADKTFTKLCSELEVTDETLFLRCLKVTPYYKYESGFLSTPYKGVPCYVYLNADGSIDSVDTGEDNYVVEDTTFYLKNVTATYTGGSYLFGESQKQIYWSGTSKDSLLSSVPPEDTLVVVCFVGYDENLNTKIFSYEELCEYELGMTLNDIRIKQGWYTTSNSFTFYTDTAFEMLEGQGYTFDGEVLLYPFYTLDGVLYEGRCSVVNVVNGEIKEVITDGDGNQEEVIIKPPETDSDGNVSNGGNDYTIDDIGDAPTYMLNILGAFMGLIGAVPNLLGAIFPFLPVEIRYLISAGLVVAIIMRVIGR